MFNVIKGNIMAFLKVSTKALYVNAKVLKTTAMFGYLFNVSFTCLKLPNLTVQNTNSHFLFKAYL